MLKFQTLRTQRIKSKTLNPKDHNVQISKFKNPKN